MLSSELRKFKKLLENDVEMFKIYSVDGELQIGKIEGKVVVDRSSILFTERKEYQLEIDDMIVTIPRKCDAVSCSISSDGEYCVLTSIAKKGELTVDEHMLRSLVFLNTRLDSILSHGDRYDYGIGVRLNLRALSSSLKEYAKKISVVVTD